MIVLKSFYCEKCPCKELQVVAFNPIIKSCEKCKDGEYNG